MLLEGAWVLADPDHAFEGGWVRIRGDGIESLGEGDAPGRGARGDVVWSMPRASIVPGFVNAHAHLDLTGLHGAIPEPPSFSSWLRALLLHKLRSGREALRASVAEGIRQSIAEGVTAIGDIDSLGLSRQALEGAGLAGVAYREVLGFRAARGLRSLARVREALAREASSPGGVVRSGVSPHTPVTTAAEVYRTTAREEGVGGVPLCTHAAESDDERAFLAEGRGDLYRFFRRFGAVPPSWRPPGVSSIRYLDGLGFLGPATLLVHANDLDEDDVRLVRRRGAPVVFCPRSHAYFGHRRLAVPRLLAAGVTVALGTDSLASNRSLSLLEEARTLRRQVPGIGARTLFAMLTAAGAAALGLGEITGRIAPGRRADLAVVVPPAGAGEDPFEALLDERTRVVATIAGGRVVGSPRVDRSGPAA